MMCQLKRAFITSVLINAVLFICLVSIPVQCTNSLSYKDGINKELNKKIVEHNETIVKQNESLVNKNKEITELTNMLEEKDIKITSQNKKIFEQNENTENQNEKLEIMYEELTQLNSKLEEKDIKITNQNKKIFELNKTIMQQNETLAAVNNKIINQNKKIDERNDIIDNQNEKLVIMYEKLTQLNNKLEEKDIKIINQNKKIFELNETIMQQNESLVNKNEELTELNNKLGENGIKETNQNKKIEELQNTLLGRAKSCKEIKELFPNSVSGIYDIEVCGEKLEVRCEMNIASGGWTVFHNRYDGSVHFDRKWTQYEAGFGDLDGEFWLGLKNVNKLTENSVNDLRVEMISFNGSKKYAEYKEFRVSSATENYKLSFKEGSYNGDAGDNLSYHNGMEFSTPDNDNDAWSDGNCADWMGGANWWYDCGEININGKYGGDGDIGHKFMYWLGFDNDKFMALKSMTLMFRRTV